MPEQGIGQTDCAQSLYAGFMTAPCIRTGEDGIVDRLCPTYDGPFQVGLNSQSCMLDDDMVWSPAYNPSATGTTSVAPHGGCITDAPESLGGCPLVSEDIPEPPPNIDAGRYATSIAAVLAHKGSSLAILAAQLSVLRSAMTGTSLARRARGFRTAVSRK